MNNNPTVAIIGAMDCEIEYLKQKLNSLQIIKTGKYNIFQGKISNTDVILVKSGVGKVSAAMTVQFIADKYKPDYIINTGIAGGLADNLSIGDVVIAESLVQYDFDVTALGYARGYMCTGINKDKPTVFYTDKKLINEIESVAKTYYTQGTIHKGTIATGDTFMSNLAMRTEIKNIFNATAVEMEGAAIGQAAEANQIPFIVIRVISDLADGKAASSLDIFEKDMAILSSKIVELLIQKL